MRPYTTAFYLLLLEAFSLAQAIALFYFKKPYNSTVVAIWLATSVLLSALLLMQLSIAKTYSAPPSAPTPAPPVI